MFFSVETNGKRQEISNLESEINQSTSTTQLPYPRRTLNDLPVFVSYVCQRVSFKKQINTGKTKGKAREVRIG